MDNSYPTCKLGSIASVQGGFAFKSSDFTKAGIPVLKIKNVRLREVDTSELDYVDKSVADGVSRYLCKTGDLLISMTGSGPQAPNSVVGRVARYSGPSDTYLINQRVGRFINKSPNKLDQRYLYYVLVQEETLWKLVSIATGSANQANISGSQIESLDIPLPPIAEQKAIAHILGTLDDKIELNRRMNATLEAMARALFQSWFVDFDPVRAKLDGRTPANLDPATAALFPSTFQDSPLGPIPSGWQVGKLGDVGTNPRRNIQPNEIEPNTPYIALEHMPRRCIALGEWEDSADVASGKSAFNKGEILFGKLRPYFHKVGVAPTDGVCSTDILVVAPKGPEWFGFLLGHATSDELIQFTDLASTGTKMPRTNWSDISSFGVALPPKAIAAAFTCAVRPMIEGIHANIHQSKTLAVLRDTLLPRLLSGATSVAKT